mmetsp:Transcript_39541/g.95069  ORF Transcript_39541/g.95069 Transcript_39541/m.95069 type:complete len:213 (-) Transcript_39541:615-1253(-)
MHGDIFFITVRGACIVWIFLRYKKVRKRHPDDAFRQTPMIRILLRLGRRHRSRQKRRHPLHHPIADTTRPSILALDAIRRGPPRPHLRRRTPHPRKQIPQPDARLDHAAETSVERKVQMPRGRVQEQGLVGVDGVRLVLRPLRLREAVQLLGLVHERAYRRQRARAKGALDGCRPGLDPAGLPHEELVVHLRPREELVEGAGRVAGDGASSG